MKNSILFSIVNYGTSQLTYLQRVVDEINTFLNYDTTIIVTTNIDLSDTIRGVDRYNVIYDMSDFQLLPLAARNVIVDYASAFDYYVYTENDHLFKEHHIDNYIKYENILPSDAIAGLIQYEENSTGRYYPAYHARYDWDYNSVVEFNGLKFAHFTNVHQASFVVSNEKLLDITDKYDIRKFITKSGYSKKCRVNTEIYKDVGYKKLICISEFENNLIHHLPNLYIDGELGRAKQRSDSARMNNAIQKLLNESTI